MHSKQVAVVVTRQSVETKSAKQRTADGSDDTKDELVISAASIQITDQK